MLCNIADHCKSRKPPKFKRKQQRLKFFKYCKDTWAIEFWKELMYVEKAKSALEESV